jgi:hypothetical protein
MTPAHARGVVIDHVPSILLAALWLGSSLVAIGVPYVVWGRRRVLRTQEVFACRIRPTGPLEGAPWSRTKRRARWVQGVLLVHRGPTLNRCDALPVASVTGPIVAQRVRGLGTRPVRLRLHLDDGRLLDLVARNADVTSAIGPFVVASLR